MALKDQPSYIIKMRAKPNTVQLVDDDGVETVPLWLGPEVVFGAFDVPANVFAFDHTRIRPRPSMREQASTKLPDRIRP